MKWHFVPELSQVLIRSSSFLARSGVDKCVKYGSVHFHNDFFRLMAQHLRIILQQIKKTISDGWEIFFFQNFRTWHIFFPYFKVGRCMSVMQCYATMLQKYSPAPRPALILMDRYSEMWNLNMPLLSKKRKPKYLG